MKYLDELRKQVSVTKPRRSGTPQHDAVSWPTDKPLEGSPAPAKACRFCDHANPAGSKFCNSCGGQLNLEPCPECGAISDGASAVCYQCSADLREAAHAGQGVSASETPAARSPSPLALFRTSAVASPALAALRKAVKNLPTLAVGAGLVLATIAMVLYYVRLQSDMDASETVAVREPAESARIRPIVKPEGIATTGAATDRGGRTGALSSRAVATGGSGATVPRVGAASCTEAVSALGLCFPAGPVRTQPTSMTGEAPASKAPQQRARCTAEAAALGLCAVPPTPRKE